MQRTGRVRQALVARNEPIQFVIIIDKCDYLVFAPVELGTRSETYSAWL